MNTDIAESVEELQNTAANCRQLMTDLGDEQRNCSSTIKNDVKQIRTELMSLCEHVEFKYSELERKIPNTKSIERRLTKLENNLRVTGTCESSKSAPDQVTVDLTGVDEAPSCRDSTYVNVNGNKPSSMNASFVAEKLPMSSGASSGTFTGTTNGLLIRNTETGLFKRSQANNSNIPSVPLMNVDASSSSQGRGLYLPSQPYSDHSIANMILRPNQGLNGVTNRTIELVPDNTNTTQSYGTFQSQYDVSDSNNEQNVNMTNMMDYQCSTANRFSVLLPEQSNTIVPGTSSFSDALKSSSAYNQLNIPVHVSNISDRQKKSRSKPPPSYTKSSSNNHIGTDTVPVNTAASQSMDTDDDFIQYIRRRPARYYVGGFKSTINEQKLSNYLLRRSINVSRINIRRYEDQDRAVIQLSVDPEYGSLLQQRGFWPPDVYCRQWYNRNEYRQKTSGDEFMSS